MLDPHKKKLLFVNGHLSVGGTEAALVNHLNAIDKDRYEVDLLLVQPGRELLAELGHGVNVISRDMSAAYGPIFQVLKNNIRNRKWLELKLRLSGYAPIRLRSRFMRLLSKDFGISKKYDVAIAFRPGLSEKIVLNCVSATRKITWWHHGDLSNGENLNVLRSNWRSFDEIVTVSDGIAAFLEKEIPEANGKTAVVYNMIDSVNITAKAQQSDGCADSKERFRIVTVSRLSREKNLGRIIDIACELRTRGIEFEWNIIGGGDLLDVLRKQILFNKLENSVFLRGEQINPYSWMRNSDMMVHPSLIESFGLVLVEAMAVGIPCVAAKSLGAKDVIGQDNGVLVDDYAAAYADAIIRIQLDPEYRSTILRNSKKAVEKYSSEKVVKSFYSVAGLE